MIQIFCVLMDLKHPLDLSKMGFFSKASACTSNVMQYCLFEAMRSGNVKHLYHYYTVSVGVRVTLVYTVLSKLKINLMYKWWIC